MKDRKYAGDLWFRVHMLMEAFYLMSMAIGEDILEFNKRTKAKKCGAPVNIVSISLSTDKPIHPSLRCSCFLSLGESTS